MKHLMDVGRYNIYPEGEAGCVTHNYKKPATPRETQHSQTRYGWWSAILVGICMFVVYLTTFATLGSKLGARADVIADADTGPFTIMLTEWSLHRKFGNAWNLQSRTDLDRTQEHKIKHVLLGVLFGYQASASMAVGLDRFVAAKVSSAVCGSLNVALVLLLFLQIGIRLQVALPTALLLAFSPGHWVFASLPESWPLTGTILLIGIIIQLRISHKPALLGAAIGIGMLNNVTMIVLCVLPLADGTIRRTPLPLLARRLLVVGMAALGVWALALLLMSSADPDLRPDRVFRFLSFFSDLVGGDGGSSFFRRLVRSVTQIVLASMVSVQPEPITGSVISSARFSSVSIFGMCAMAILYFFASTEVWRQVRARTKAEWRPLVLVIAPSIALWGILFWRFPVFTWFYSPALLPPLVLALGICLEDSGRRLTFVIWAAAVIVAMCGYSQVAILRTVAMAAG